MANNEEIRNNLSSFKETFKDYLDCYTIIGGTACYILLEDAGLSFRATHDIDMILILEDKKEDFARKFWEYIIEGKYTCGWKQSKANYYRFTNPKAGYPKQIELFSKRNDFKLDKRIMPVHISDDVSSLSAIALDDDFYNFMLEGRKEVNGLSVLDASYIIPFKMYAWLNNIELKNSGQLVSSDDIKKHKNDVFRLLQLVIPSNKIKVKGSVKKAISDFMIKIENEDVDTEKLGLNFTKNEGIDILKNIYY